MATPARRRFAGASSAAGDVATVAGFTFVLDLGCIALVALGLTHRRHPDGIRARSAGAHDPCG